jgi:hypothetical protein
MEIGKEKVDETGYGFGDDYIGCSDATWVDMK